MLSAALNHYFSPQHNVTYPVQNVHHLHGHMPEDAFFTGQLPCQ